MNSIILFINLNKRSIKIIKKKPVRVTQLMRANTEKCDLNK